MHILAQFEFLQVLQLCIHPVLLELSWEMRNIEKFPPHYQIKKKKSHVNSKFINWQFFSMILGTQGTSRIKSPSEVWLISTCKILVFPFVNIYHWGQISMFKEKLHCGSSFASSDLLAAYSHHIQAPGAYSVVISDLWLAANTVVLLLEKGKG